jgi:hypothetical protein
VTAILCLLALATALPPKETEPAPWKLDVSAGGGATERRLFYKDRLTPTLAGWQSGVLPLWGLALQAYPATGRLPILDDIGVYGRYERSLKSSTLTADAQLEFDTQEISWEAGVRWRALSAGHEYAAISVGYGTERWDFTGARLPGFLLPAGTIQYWKPGLEGRLWIGPVSLGLGAAYLLVVRHDFLATYFPRATTGGVEGLVRVTYDWRKFGLTLTGRYARFFSALHPEPYDPYVAGGVLDETFTVHLALGYRL